MQSCEDGDICDHDYPTPTPSGGGGNNPNDPTDEADDPNPTGIYTVSLDANDLVCGQVNCDFWATALGMAGTAADLAAFLVNLPFLVGADVAALLTALGIPVGPLGYGAAVATYQLAAPISNAFGFLGLAMWAGQGVLTGESSLGMNITLNLQGQLKAVNVYGAISQDTVFSLLNDTLALALKEPNVATLWSGVGVAYDLERNPLAPYLSSAPPIFPTVIQPRGSMTYNFQTNSLSGSFGLWR